MMLSIKKNIIHIIAFFSFWQYACESQQKQQTIFGPNAPKVVKASGVVFPKELMVPPKVVPARGVKKIAVGKPKVVNLVSNINPVGGPVIKKAGAPVKCTPGQDTFKLPEIVPAIDSHFTAGLPEVVVAKDAQVKENNSESFSSFTVLQGLGNNMIFSLIQDKAGNLWIGTFGGGVDKYDGRSFSHYSTAQGLSDKNILSILEDKRGDLWFGTNSGDINKYAGKSFSNYTLNKGGIAKILEDKKGNLWFGTWGGGVTKYDGKSFAHYSTAQGLSDENVISILEDKKGNLWFGTEGSVSKYDGKSFYNYTTAQGFNSGLVWSILEDRKGNIWFGTDNGVCKYDGKTFSNYTTAQGLGNNEVWKILEDKSGNLWFGTGAGGVCKYDGSFFTNYTTAQGLSDNKISGLLEDKSGIIWIGTMGGGLNKFDGKPFTQYTIAQGLSSKSIGSIQEDKSGNLWFGTDSGVSKYDGKSFTNYTIAQGLSSDRAATILEDKGGNLWIGTWGGGLNKFDGKTISKYARDQGLISDRISTIFEDKSGNLWLGSNVGKAGVIKFDGESFTNYTTAQGLSNNDITCISQDKSGNLWFGTAGGGINKYDGRLFTNYSVNNGLNDVTVYSILEDKSKNIWFGTNNGGVNKFDGNSFIQYTTAQGLSNNYVTGILEDKEGDLWFGTLNGISRMQLKKATENKSVTAASNAGTSLFKNYLISDGFLGVGRNDIHNNTLFQDSKGKIWVSSNDGLSCFHPESEIPDTIAPNIQLTGISLFNENINWLNVEKKKDTSIVLSNGVKVNDFKFSTVSQWYNIPENLELAYYNNYLTFQFIGITTKRPKEVKYQYLLEGLDENWSTITNRTEASYSDLSGGTYTFIVKAINSGGYWSNEIRYNFTIYPPWWRTWWFRTIMGISFLFVLYGVYRLRTATLRKQKRVLEQTVKERTAEVLEEKAEVEKRNIVIQKEKDKSDELLLNILPSEVAEELKEKGYTTAKAFEEVTVLFSDIKGFTHVAERMTAQELVKEIDTYFSAFDRIMLQFGLEKIKTIGDAYIAAGGLPEKNSATAQNVVEAAIAMQQAVEKLKQERVSSNKPFFELRIGIHTGPVVAGVVGIKKFQYDIWGDTVNLAARMEQSGVPGKINISKHTCELVKDQFTCIHRGKIDAKNKGEIDMYFVE